MFRALSCPSSGACQTAVAASGFRMNVEVEVLTAVVGLLLTIIRTPSNCRCSLWFPYECGGGSAHCCGQFVTKEPTTAVSTFSSTFILKPEAAMAV